MALNIKTCSDVLLCFSETTRNLAEQDIIVLNENGERAAAIIPYELYEKVHYDLYVLRKLAESESAAKDPSKWISGEDFIKEMNARVKEIKTESSAFDQHYLSLMEAEADNDDPGNWVSWDVFRAGFDELLDDWRQSHK